MQFLLNENAVNKFNQLSSSCKKQGRKNKQQQQLVTKSTKRHKKRQKQKVSCKNATEKLQNSANINKIKKPVYKDQPSRLEEFFRLKNRALCCLLAGGKKFLILPLLYLHRILLRLLIFFSWLLQQVFPPTAGIFQPVFGACYFPRFKTSAPSSASFFFLLRVRKSWEERASERDGNIDKVELKSSCTFGMGQFKRRNHTDLVCISTLITIKPGLQKSPNLPH